MRWLKLFVVSFFIGFYFLSITPVHFYAHNSDTLHSTKSQNLDDCSYVKLLQTGQGNYLDSDVFHLAEDVENPYVKTLVKSPLNLRLEDDFIFDFHLRGPPVKA